MDHDTLNDMWPLWWSTIGPVANFAKFCVKGRLFFSSMRWAPKLCHITPKLCCFCQFWPSIFVTSYPNQSFKKYSSILVQNKIEMSSSHFQECTMFIFCSNNKIEWFLYEICHQVCGIKLMSSFHPLYSII